ncbi:hypothetical protein F5Y19DRAFT_489058 [Xylariaceae sp. FL1651]|nr:hypothetical protein F5Y19DRAFT_489058 [Xylariaceae sp. FL1651]
MDKFKDYVDYVLSITDYVIAWVIDATKGAARMIFRRNPEFVPETDQMVNPDGQPKTNAEFVTNVRNAFKDTPAERFFKNNPKFIEELADKAAALANSPDTPICGKDLLPKTAQVTMHQQVLYCDDSSSMKRQGRWNSQNLLINRIARVTTRILPDGEGVYMRYINQDVPNSDSLKFEELVDVIKPLTWGGDTPIGTNLKSKILEPLVYRKLPNDLKRPLLVSVITDGMPEPEPKSTFVDAIAECGDKLEAAGLPRESVKFMIGQVGSSDAATRFLQDIGSEKKIAKVVFVASEKLDVAASNLESDWKMDEWLIETLYAPIMKSEEGSRGRSKQLGGTVQPGPLIADELRTLYQAAFRRWDLGVAVYYNEQLIQLLSATNGVNDPDALKAHENWKILRTYQWYM